MRSAFSKAIVDAATADSKILLLTGDHGYALFDEFRQRCPAQFINAGIAEQNMIGVAAGLAKAGFKPIVYGLSAFVPVRVLEQIKMDVCYENLPVVFIGDGAGVVYSSLGSSHQSTEDIAMLRPIPNIQILSPSDAYEMAYVMDHALKFTAPTYIRIGKSDVGITHECLPTALMGDLLPVRIGGNPSTVLLATGAMVQTAMKLAQELDDCAVWSMPGIKPFNHQQLLAVAATAENLVVLEEHSNVGGIGGLVAEIVSESTGAKPRVIRCGMQDRFSEKCGSYGYLMREHQLDKNFLLVSLKSKLKL
ncbi:transketolase [Janthinobacterium lividum]|uniref:transketolase family protein n=1 Tax=Janthinobacterium lividum TaxID=29581 RepID=UPI0005379C40|nr:transketolase C-terminal domain-containing protein [Janthinobacterium lividum]KHA80292.1 transketolase [Janthinobacterium lividum]QKY05606.1 transketolase [Janthinobacterium lividum]